MNMKVGVILILCCCSLLVYGQLQLDSIVLNNSENVVPKFRVCWAKYVGFVPWAYADVSGILQKHASRHGIEIEMVEVPHFIDSLMRFVTKDFDACTMTMEEAGGIQMAEAYVNRLLQTLMPTMSTSLPVNGTVLLTTSYSNGNDAVVSRQAKTMQELEGQTILVEQGTAQEYLVYRGLDLFGVDPQSVTLVGSSLDDIHELEQGEIMTATLRQPALTDAMMLPGSRILFDSSDIPGEIVDLMVVNSQKLADYPQLGKVLVATWFEIMQLLEDVELSEEVIEGLAALEGVEKSGFKAQLKYIKLFSDASEAAEFMQGSQMIDTVRQVMKYVYSEGIFNEVFGATRESKGVAFPEGVVGDADNIRLTFDPTFVQQYVQNQTSIVVKSLD